VNGAASARPRWPATLGFAATAAFLAVVAAQLMFGTYMFYDDEGYVLLSYRNFAEQGGLYREVFSQYGPLPFVAHWALHLAGLPLSHATGRTVTLIIWVMVALTFAVLAERATRSFIATLSSLVATFACLFVMTSEPSHPGGLIVALVAVAGAGGWLMLREGAFGHWSSIAGATIAALLLTKINVGAFAAFAALAWFALHLDHPRWRPAAIAFLLTACVILPPALMRALAGEDWVSTLAKVWTTSALAIVVVLARRSTPCVGPRTLLPAVLAGSLAAGVIIAVPLSRGSEIGDLLEGVLLAPMRNAVRYSNAYGWWPGIDWAAAASLAGAVGAAFAPDRWRERTDFIVAVLRLAATAALAVSLAWPPVFLGAFKVYGFVLPCLWVFAWPLSTEDAGTVRARAWLVILLLGQCLHAYPVAGSQVAWACVLAIPVAAMGAAEAATRLGLSLDPAWRRAVGLTLAAGFLAAAGATAHGLNAEARRREGRPLVGLPGTGPLRQPPETAALLRVMTLNAVAHADVLFSEPGMFSFNLWSGVPTPTGANVTHWFSLLEPDRQREIVRRLAGTPRAAVIVDQGHVAFLRARGLAPAGPLHDFIAREFTPAFRVADFEFHVRRGRSVRPFLVAELFNRAESANTGERHLLRLPLLLPTSRPVESIEISPGHPAALRLSAATARLEVTPLSSRGDPTGPSAPAKWPLVTTGPALVSIYFDSFGPASFPREAALLLRNAEGGEEGLARLAP
jgi:hypothetical protein